MGAVVFTRGLLLAAVIAALESYNEPPAMAADLYVPAAGTWGYPPEEDWPVATPELPEYQGWYRFLSANGSGKILATAENIVIIQVDDDILGLDLASGEMLWRQEFEDSWTILDRMLIGQGTAYYSTHEELVALSLANGDVLWRAPGVMALASGDEYIWAAKSNWHHKNFMDKAGAGLLLIDAATGEVKRKIDLGKLLGAGKAASPMGDWMAVATSQEIKVCKVDGTVHELPRARQDWHARIALGPAGFLVCEYPPEEGITDLGEDGYTSEYLATLVNPETGEPGGNLIVSYYETEGPQLLWRREFDEYDFRYVRDLAGPYCSSHYAALNRRPGLLLVLHLGDGSTAYEVPKVESTLMRADYALLDDVIFYVGFTESGDNDVLLTVDLARGAETQLPSKMRIPGSQMAAIGNTLLLLQSTGGWGTTVANNKSLIAYTLDDQLMPVPGLMNAVELPQAYASLRKRFFANVDPLADDELMSELVSAGISAMGRMLEAVTIEDRSQLDALAAAAAYIYAASGTDVYGVSAQSVFIDSVRELASPELVEILASWLAEDSLALLHIQLLGVLAQCGDAAAEELALRYRLLAPSKHTGAGPPYRGVLREDVVARYIVKHQGWIYAERSAEEAGSWYVSVEQEDYEGRRYVLYSSPGLLSFLDLYLGIDNDGDGWFEEVLPTGLIHIPLQYRLERLDAPPDEAEQLILRLHGESIVVGQHQPVYGAEEHSGRRLARTQFVESELQLAALRLDSDGDGLTDIVEGMLLTDPFNDDTDADGLSDQEDPTPLVHADDMGWEERGVARALAYFFASKESQRTRAQHLVHPWRARYLYIVNVGQVAFAPDSSWYGISLHDEQLGESYYKQAGGGWANEVLPGEWIPPRQVSIAQLQTDEIPNWFLDTYPELADLTDSELKEHWLESQSPFWNSENYAL